MTATKPTDRARVHHGAQQPPETFHVQHSDAAEAARQRMMRDNANAWRKIHRKGWAIR